MIIHKQPNSKFCFRNCTELFRKFLRGGSALSGVLAVSVMAGSLQVYATQETQQALDKARQEANETRQAISENKDTLDALNDTKSDLSEQWSNLNSQLSGITSTLAELSAKINDKQGEISAKQEEISQTEKELEEAVQTQEEQYAAMKKRIQFLYERGNRFYLEILLHSGSYGDLLNKSSYIKQLNDYDTKTLEKYKETAKEIQQHKQELEQEQEALEKQQDELEDLRSEVNSKAGQVTGLLTQTAGSLNSANAQISSAQDAVDALQDQLDSQNETVSALEKQLAEERRLQELSNASVWRNLSDISFADQDRYLLANLIYCEAGGEPYEGQVAVGAVVMNRVKSGAFPGTVSEVIYQRWQFEPAMTGRLALALSENRATDSCYQAADAAMAGQTTVGECLFFRTPIPQIEPKYRIGGHIFY